MKHLLFLLSFLPLVCFAQVDFNMDVMSYTALDEPGNDCWGFVDAQGTEYALIGGRNNSYIYSLEDPAAPALRATIPGSNSVWRDFKFNGDYVYVTTDSGSDGLLIIDMTNAPETITHVFWRPDLTLGNNSGTLRTCHNLYIDENGVCYLAGCNVVSGIIILDINTNPMEPTVLGYENDAYAHDVVVQRDTMYTSEINIGEFSMYDVSDKSDPRYIGGANTSSNFCHNAWFSDDGKYLYTTDERPNAFVDSYDISDVNNIQRLDTYQPAETADKGVIPHNAHFLNEYLITSWYTDGVVITDVSRPDNIVKVGSFDTFDGPDGNFNGCWGAYPWLPSGLIIASNFSNSANDNSGGFYILNPTYVRAAFLEGIVRDASTGDLIPMVDVTFNSPIVQTLNTNAIGEFKTGSSETGTFELSFNHPDYQPLTMMVDVNNGDVTFIEAELEPKVSVTISGSVVKTLDGSSVPFADVIVFGEGSEIRLKADENGNFTSDAFAGDFTAVAGAWGYSYQSLDISLPSSDPIVFELSKQYQDDFLFDYNWRSTGDASTGAWELGIPQGTDFDGSAANPGEDQDTDLGNKAYVTGNGGGGAGNDDVDNGTVVLTSPKMDLSDYDTPEFTFSYWFFNEGGNSEPNDTLFVNLNNGIERVNIFTHPFSASGWRTRENVQWPEGLELTDSVMIEIITSDFDGSGHLVEAGFDAFLVENTIVNSSEDLLLNSLVIYPNPVDNELNIAWDGQSAIAVINNIHGQKVLSQTIENGLNKVDLSKSVQAGVYVIQITDEAGKVQSLKFVKQ